MKIVVILILFFIPVSCFSQKATVIKLPQLESLLNQKNDTTYIINFWATWCQPCVKELPFFLEEEAAQKNEKVRFVFISLDFKRELDSRLNVFLKDRKMNSTVYLIDEPDYDSWIDKVDPSWQGNIPATLVYNFATNKRQFFAKDFEPGELHKALLNLK